MTLLGASSEQAYYLIESGKILWAVAPIGVIFVALAFLRHSQPSLIMFWLRLTTGVWLLVSIANRILLGWAVGRFGPGAPSLNRLETYTRVGGYGWIVEGTAFLCFAILLLLWCRTFISKAR
jgi:hypothetical protein